MIHRMAYRMVDPKDEFDELDYNKNYVVLFRVSEPRNEDWNYYIDNPIRGDRPLQIIRRC